MSGRFSKFTKIPQEPAAKLLAYNNIPLAVKLDAPASASVETVLQELEDKQEYIEILKVFCAALPPREKVWWACLAARDILGQGPENETRALRAAEAWVFRPTDENREAAIDCVDQSERDDKSVSCALAVMYSGDTIGGGDQPEIPTPLGGCSMGAFSMVADSLSFQRGNYDAALQEMIERAVDIARGGNGKRSSVAQEAN